MRMDTSPDESNSTDNTPSKIVLSVVIPAYNEEERLGGTLQRVDAYLASRGSPFEVIVVDDGSSDGTVRVAGEFASAHGNVRVIRNGSNRGKGFSTSSSPTPISPRRSRMSRNSSLTLSAEGTMSQSDHGR